MTELSDAFLLDLRVVRLEKCILLFADHVGATGWNPELQKVLDEIQADLRSVA
jgi:hypothetical protein